MPLVVITGIPCSGKTTRAIELKEYFQSRSKTVHVVSEFEQIEKAGFIKSDLYIDMRKEKHIRSALKSEVLRLINTTDVVILDGLNYIKGYRYELYCGSKANKCSQCTIHAEINRALAWEYNEKRNDGEKFCREIFDALVLRYETPDSKNRWDSPLFLIFPDGTLDKDAIYNCLFHVDAPKPNTSTQNAPLSSTNFLYDLDKVTKQIVDGIIKMKSMGITGAIKVPDFEDLEMDISNVTVQQLMILRRQYLTYSKMHPPDPRQVPLLFVQYMTSTFSK